MWDNASSSRTRIITGPYEALVDRICRKRHEAIPRAIMKIPELSDKVVEEIMKKVNKECKILTSLKFKSKLRQTTLKSLKNFKWADVVAEWKTNAPTYNRFLECASNIPKDPPAPQKSPLTPRGIKYEKSKRCTMAMAGSTLLRARCQSMSAHMYRNAMVIRHGGAKKRCFERLVKVGVCVSPEIALQKLKAIAQTWDRKVIKWKKHVCKSYVEGHPLAKAKEADHPLTAPHDHPATAASVDTGPNKPPTPGANDPQAVVESHPLVQIPEIENQVHCFYKLWLTTLKNVYFKNMYPCNGAVVYCSIDSYTY